MASSENMIRVSPASRSLAEMSSVGRPDFIDQDQIGIALFGHNLRYVGRMILDGPHESLPLYFVAAVGFSTAKAPAPPLYGQTQPVFQAHTGAPPGDFRQARGIGLKPHHLAGFRPHARRFYNRRHLRSHDPLEQDGRAHV